MARRTRAAVVGGVLVSALALIGAGFPAKQVPPAKWATGVCTTVNEWVSATESGANDLNAALTGTNPNLRDVRDALSSYLGDTAHGTTIALDGLAAAGTPATPKGKQAAAGLATSFKKIRKSLRELQGHAEDLSIKHRAKARKQVKKLNRQVSAEFKSFNDALAGLRKLDPNHKLKAAFQAEPACQQLGG